MTRLLAAVAILIATQAQAQTTIPKMMTCNTVAAFQSAWKQVGAKTVMILEGMGSSAGAQGLVVQMADGTVGLYEVRGQIICNVHLGHLQMFAPFVEDEAS